MAHLDKKNSLQFRNVRKMLIPRQDLILNSDFIPKPFCLFAHFKEKKYAQIRIENKMIIILFSIFMN